jgi:hypothetical protein
MLGTVKLMCIRPKKMRITEFRQPQEKLGLSRQRQ